MESLLPIILGIVFLIYQQYKKTTKKRLNPAIPQRNAQKRPLNHPKEGGTEEKLDDFIKTFFGEEKVVQPVESDYYYEEVVEPEAEIKAEETVLDSASYSIEYDNNINLKNRNKNQAAYAIKEEVNILDTFVFDPRDAMIYDAILNPPYIKN